VVPEKWAGIKCGIIGRGRALPTWGYFGQDNQGEIVNVRAARCGFFGRVFLFLGIA
jgi:hypothetical protein